MNINYTGKHGVLPANQQKKLDAKFAKFAKLVERRGQADKGAHVVITTERHLTNAEITVLFHDHSLVAVGSGTDFFTAVNSALDRAEKQALKMRTKWRDTKRGAKDKSVDGAGPTPTSKVVAKATKAAGSRRSAPPTPVDEEIAPQVFRVNHHEKRKPMTAEEALIALGDRDYMVYRDADKDCVSVLIRRKDGNFDLVES